MSLRESRIKTYDFSQLISGSPTTTSYYPVNNEVQNGEILDVAWKTENTGSLFLQLSGTNQVFFSRIAPSGTNWQFGQPRQFTQSTAGSIANAQHAPFNCHDPIVVAVSGMFSGANPLQVQVKYR